MAKAAREVEAQALKLPREERARLAEKLISSLDQESDPDAEELWLREAERRLGEIESGDVAMASADSVIEKVRSNLR